MNLSAYFEQAPWALAVLGVCLTLLVVGSAFGIVAIARMTACSAGEAAKALATVLTSLRSNSGRRIRADLTSPDRSEVDTAQRQVAQLQDRSDRREVEAPQREPI